MFTKRTLWEGRWPMAVLAALTVAGFWWSWPAGMAALVLLGFTIGFFRDPERAICAYPQAIVAPADGKVVDIETVNEPQFLSGPVTRVGIFMSVFNVHIQRAPIAGEIKLVNYQPGKFLNAHVPQAALTNENRLIGIEAGDGYRVAVRQIAGLIARRIVGWAGKGDRLKKGQRFGMIRFGSRVELYLPTGTDILTCVGASVQAGATILARRTTRGPGV
jgi:phosphatidylserine decarboxylase